MFLSLKSHMMIYLAECRILVAIEVRECFEELIALPTETASALLKQIKQCIFDVNGLLLLLIT